MRTYALDTTAAKEANNGGKRISEPGEYTGKIRAAWHEVNEKGTESVHIIFASDGGQEAGPLALYTHKGDGTTLPSYKTLNAIMACCKVRELKPTRGPVKLWNRDANAEVEKQKDIFPALSGKPLGLVLQAEEYENRNFEVKERMVIAAPFEAGTRKMAEEVLTQSPDAKALDKYLTWFSNGHQVKKLKSRNHAESAPAPQSDNFDDIPFD